MDDELRQRLGRLDPLDAAIPTDDTSSPRVRALLEEIMNTSVENPPATSVAGPRPPKRRLLVLSGVAAAIIAVAVGIGIASSGNDASQSRRSLSVEAATPGRTCIRFSTDLLAQASDAFSGTVTAVTDSTLTIAVDHWYKASGAKADIVDVATGTSLPFLGVDFTKGDHYLVSATDGHVNGCGFSGPDESVLAAAFTTAFG